MDFRPTPFNITTLLLVAATIWLIVARFRIRLDSNWPLFYYVFLVAYMRGFEGSLQPGWVFAGVVVAMFLRFEFLGGWVVQMFRLAELAVLFYVLYRCLGMVFFF